MVRLSVLLSFILSLFFSISLFGKIVETSQVVQITEEVNRTYTDQDAMDFLFKLMNEEYVEVEESLEDDKMSYYVGDEEGKKKCKTVKRVDQRAFDNTTCTETYMRERELQRVPYLGK